MTTVFICAPLRGRDLVEADRNKQRARRITGDILREGKLPLTPHYFGERHVLDPFNPDDDALGRAAALHMLAYADEIRVYGPPTEGMLVEIRHAEFLRERRGKRGEKVKPRVAFRELPR